jgi:hypothetical protein
MPQIGGRSIGRVGEAVGAVAAKPILEVREKDGGGPRSQIQRGNAENYEPAECEE